MAAGHHADAGYVSCLLGADFVGDCLAGVGAVGGGEKAMNRQEMIELRDHLQSHITGLTEILRKVQLELENPAPPEYDPYDDLGDDLDQADDRALNDRS